MRLFGFMLAVALGFADESGIAADGLAKKLGSPPLFFIEDSANRYLIQVPGIAAVFTRHNAEFHAGGAAVRAIFQGANSALEMHGA